MGFDRVRSYFNVQSMDQMLAHIIWPQHSVFVHQTNKNETEKEKRTISNHHHQRQSQWSCSFLMTFIYNAQETTATCVDIHQMIVSLKILFFLFHGMVNARSRLILDLNVVLFLSISRLYVCVF